LLDSGSRLVEVAKVYSEFKEENAKQIKDFYRVEIGAFRGTKQAFYGYFTEATFKTLTAIPFEPLTIMSASRYYRKMGFIQPKYLRKFAFDSMISLEVPESVADFIEGRVPKRVGAKHYMALRRQADKFYPKYALYLRKLRKKALGETYV
jgi:intergrase/recombinase